MATTTLQVAGTHQLDQPILQGLTQLSSTQHDTLGKRVKSSDGREYMYVRCSTDMTAMPIAGYPAMKVAGVLGEVTSDVAPGLGMGVAGAFLAR